MRELALAAPRHPGAAGRRRHLLLPRSRPGRAGHRPARGAGRGGRAPAPALAGDGRRPHGVRLAAHVPDRAGHLVVPEDRCHRILEAAGLPVAAARLVQDAPAAVAAAEALGFPVVLKGISPSVTHRAAAGLLAVDLRTAAEVTAAFAPPRGARPRDRGGARRRLRPEDAPGRHRAPARGVPRSDVRGDGVLRERRRADGADRRRRDGARAGRPPARGQHAGAPADSPPRARRSGPAARRAGRGLSRALLRARAHGAVAPLRLRGESRQVDAGRRGRRGRAPHHRAD